MYHYGQYCPVAKAVEILGDRWTLLIVRDLLTGTCHFNDLERGLPGISRGLLADRLRRLQRTGLVEKVEMIAGRQRTAYYLTSAGQELEGVIAALLTWGAQWAFGEPDERDLDPLLLMWWIQNRICFDRLPTGRTVVQFDFVGAKSECYWLLLTQDDASLCETDPGFGVDVLVTADVAMFFQVWAGRCSYYDALRSGHIVVDAPPELANALPDWLAYSLAAPAVRAVMSETAEAQI